MTLTGRTNPICDKAIFRRIKHLPNSFEQRLEHLVFQITLKTLYSIRIP